MERDQASNEVARLNDEHSLLQKSYEALTNQYRHEYESRNMNEEKLGIDLEAALELVEKQNSLSLSFEAKIEALKRDRQVRAAQVSNLKRMLLAIFVFSLIVIITHILIYAYICSSMYIYIYTCILMCTYIYSYINILIHTYMRIRR